MNAKRLLHLAAAILLAGILSSCGPAATTMAPTQNSSIAGARSNLPMASTPEPPSAAESPAVEGRLVIKNASLEIVVDDPDQALQAISAMAGQTGGFVVNSSLFKTRDSSGNEVPQATITIRVLAQKLDETLSKIHALVKNKADDISNENITGQDVTDEYIDLNSRLTNLQATEKQLQQIMQTTTKTEDALAVFKELTDIRQEIEVIQGKMQFYEKSASFSSITVNILAHASIAPVKVGGWEPVGVARDALQALVIAGKFLVNLVIWMAIFVLPLGLVIYFPVRFLRKQIKRLKGKPKPPATIAPVGHFQQ